MGAPLKNPPVYYTVVQARFNAILALVDFLPAIQEKFRKAGYPDYVARPTTVLQFGPGGPGSAAPKTITYDQYSFTNVARTHSFVLDPYALSLQSTNYGRFETFSAEFIKGLARVHSEVRLDLVERIGLRYLDRVTPKDGDTLEKYLIPEVLGLSHRGLGKTVHTYSETMTDVDGVTLVSRIVTQEGGLAFPPDVQPLGLAVDKRFTEHQGLHAILDTDGYVTAREAYSEERMSKVLHVIHEAISASFKVTATKHAFTVWDE